MPIAAFTDDQLSALLSSVDEMTRAAVLHAYAGTALQPRRSEPSLKANSEQKNTNETLYLGTADGNKAQAQSVMPQRSVSLPKLKGIQRWIG